MLKQITNMKTRALLIVVFMLFCLLFSTNLFIAVFKPNFYPPESVHVIRGRPDYDNYALVDKYREDSWEEYFKQINPTRPEIELGTDDEWHMITSELLVYSAHVDSRLTGKQSDHFIKIIGLGPMSGVIPNITCLLHYDYTVQKTSLEVYYKINTMKPWEGQSLDSYVFMCRLEDETLPNGVSFRSENTPLTTSKITAHQNSNEKYRHRFSVCVEPLTQNYDDAAAIRHFIVVNSYFGAEHFYFYNMSASHDVNNLLHELQNKGLVTVFHWTLGRTDFKTHSSAQKAMNNHCILHNINLSRYIAMIDIDEVLVPQYQQHRELITIPSWNDILTNQCSKNNENIGAYVIQSQLFPHGDQMNGTSTIPDHFWSLDSLQSTNPFPLYQWSKVLIDTERVDIMDIHKVNQMIPAYTVCNVSSEIAAIFHYRFTTTNSFPIQLNDYMNQYEEQLLSTYQALFNI